MALDNKITNIIGVRLPQWIIGQLKTRSEKGSLDQKDNSNLLYISNKSAWVRLISSVNINSFSDRQYFKGLNATFEESDTEEGLSKNFVLFGGSSFYVERQREDDSLIVAQNLRAGVGRSYSPLGQQEIQKYGYRPMPGLTSVRIETQGRLGSVRSATIEFTCWDKDQLDIIDTLYFKLGYHMFIDWGHTKYYPNKFTPIGTQNSDADKLLSTELFAPDLFSTDLSKELILKTISETTRSTYGNYGAMLGMVTNFNFKFNQNGGYDCTLKLISLGGLADSIKINGANPISEYTEILFKEYKDVATATVPDAPEPPPPPQPEPALPPLLEALRKQSRWDQTEATKNNIFIPVFGGPDPYDGAGGQNQVSKKYDVLVVPPQNLVQGNFIWIRRLNQFIPANEETLTRYPTTVKIKPLDNQMKNFETIIPPLRDNAGTIIATPKDRLYDLKSWEGYNQNDYYKDYLVKEENTQKWGFKISGSFLSNSARSSTFQTSGFAFTSGIFRTVGIEQPADQIRAAGIAASRIAPAEDINNFIEDLRKRGFFPKSGATNYNIVVNMDALAKNKDQRYLGNQPIENYQDDFTWTPGAQFGLTADRSGKKKKISEYVRFRDSDDNFVDTNLQVNLHKNVIANNIESILTQEKTWELIAVKQTSANVTPRFSFPDIAQYSYVFSLKVIYPTKWIMTAKDLVDNQGRSKPDQTKEFLRNDTFFQIIFETEDSRWISEIISSGLDYLQPPRPNAPTNSEQTQPEQTIDPTAVESPFEYMSSLESILRAIQLSSLIKAQKPDTAGPSKIVEQVTPIEIDWKRIYKDNGIFSINDIERMQEDAELDAKENDYNSKNIAALTEKERLLIQARYGFATNLMGYREPLISDTNQLKNFKRVNYYKPEKSDINTRNILFSSYVLPYKTDHQIDNNTPIQHPVYITFSHLLFILNHTCTIYDADFSERSDSGDRENIKKPLVYIDFNTEHNFCLTTPRQLTTDPLKVLIPFEGSNADYFSLFDQDILEKRSDGTAYAIQNPTGSGDPIDLFSPRNQAASDNRDNISGGLPEFKRSVDGGYSAYKGKVLNILLSIDYLVDLVKQYSTEDTENKVYLKPFIDRILTDINKSIGNINIFRLSYNDDANTFQIVDDQYIPTEGDVEKQLSAVYDSTTRGVEEESELPVYGKNSIARSLEISTEINNRLASMIAISANADPNSQSDMSLNGDNFGVFNTGSYDRFVPNRVPSSTSQITSNAVARKKTAIQFNKAISSFYNSSTPSADLVSFCTNYYIDRMISIKGQDAPTKASAMIPLSVNFSTDGIFGISMGQAFTLPQTILPYTYAPRTGETDRVGFVVTGVVHNIQNNSWTTNIKANMIYLKDRGVFVTTEPPKATPGVVQGVETYADSGQPTIEGAAVDYPYRRTEGGMYSNIFLGTGNLGPNVANDWTNGQINAKLLDDINKAAKAANVTVIITTAKSDHEPLTSTGRTSRHVDGTAVDIAIIRDENRASEGFQAIASSGAINTQIKPAVVRFTGELKNLGYTINVGDGGTAKKAVLTYGFVGHNDHVHVYRTRE